MTMKSWFAVMAMLALALPGRAGDEIKFRGAKWDDLSTALSIRPFYLEVKSDTAARTVRLVLDVYQGGKLVEQYSSSGLSRQEAGPIDLKSALFFMPKENSTEYAVTWTVELDNNFGTSRFIVPKSMIDLTSMSSGAASTDISKSPRTLVARILCNSKEGYSTSNDLAAIIAANKTATVIGVFLERE